MRKILLIIVMITAVVLIVGCQEEVVPDSCSATLIDIMEDFWFMDVTGVVIEDAENVLIPGGEIGQAIGLNEETLVLSRYPSSEEAAEQLTPAMLQETFSGIGTVTEDSPVVFGDESSWVQLDDEAASNLLVARYGDRLAIGQGIVESGVQGMISGFDDALLAYINDHPECAYLHPEKR